MITNLDIVKWIWWFKSLEWASNHSSNRTVFEINLNQQDTRVNVIHFKWSKRITWVVVNALEWCILTSSVSASHLLKFRSDVRSLEWFSKHSIDSLSLAGICKWLTKILEVRANHLSDGFQHSSNMLKITWVMVLTLKILVRHSQRNQKWSDLNNRSLEWSKITRKRVRVIQNHTQVHDHRL